MKPINVLSLFDGMSCGMIALERAGIPVNEYYASEIDKYATQVSESNYPNIIRLGDVTEVSGCLYDIDLLIGGSPCQGFSFAGKQINFEDPRSKLFFEYVRILKEIRITNPNVKFLLENVRMKKEYQDIISGLLGVEPIEINSALVSAQNRVRLYWTNIEGVTQPEDKGIMLKDIIEAGYVEKDKSWCMLESWNRFSKTTESVKGRYKKCMMPIVFSNPNCRFESGWRPLNIRECERLQTVPAGFMGSVKDNVGAGILGNGWTVDVIAHIFKNLKI